MYILLKQNGKAFGMVDNVTLQDMINKTSVDFKPCVNDSTRTKVIFKKGFAWGTKSTGIGTSGLVLQLLIQEGDQAVPKEVIYEKE